MVDSNFSQTFCRKHFNQQLKILTQRQEIIFQKSKFQKHLKQQMLLILDEKN